MKKKAGRPHSGKERINVMLPPELTEPARRAANARGMSRSDLIEELLRGYLTVNPPPPKFTPAEQARKVREYKRAGTRKGKP